MRVLLVVHNYPPFGLTGVERVTQQTAGSLQGLGHDVSVLVAQPTAAPPVPRLERGVRDGVEILTIAGGGSRHRMFPGPKAVIERIFERVILDLEPDVVVLSHLIHHSPSYVAIAQRWEVPVVVELHDFYACCELAHLQRKSGEQCDGPDGGAACAVHCFDDQERALERWAMRTSAFRHALRRADAIVCPSEFVAAYFAERWLGGCEIDIVPNGIAIAEGSPLPSPGRDQPLHLASIGAIIPTKGQHVVLAALRTAGLPRVRYSLFGVGSEQYTQELRAAAAGLDGVELRIAGRFDPPELPGLLADVDAVVVPSTVWETFSLVAREAMACGRPVIAARMGALGDAVRDGENGLVFDPQRPAELAEIIRGLDADRGRLERLRAGIRRTDWVSSEERTLRLLAILERTIANRRGHPDAASELEELANMRAIFSESRGS